MELAVPVQAALFQFPTSADGLAAIKVKAESGDHAAQKAFGDQFQQSLKYSAAEHWYQASARQGNASAICALGELYHRNMGFGTNAVKGNLTNALALHQLAGAIGERRSHFHLAHAYLQGKTVPRSSVQAYKHFKLAGPSVGNDMYLKQLILEMTQGEMAQAENEARSFRTTNFQRAFENLVFDSIRIGGVVIAATQRTAIINGKPIALAGSTTLNVATLPATITCQAIEKDRVTIAFGATRRSIPVTVRSNSR